MLKVKVIPSHFYTYHITIYLRNLFAIYLIFAFLDLALVSFLLDIWNISPFYLLNCWLNMTRWCLSVRHKPNIKNSISTRIESSIFLLEYCQFYLLNFFLMSIFFSLMFHCFIHCWLYIDYAKSVNIEFTLPFFAKLNISVAMKALSGHLILFDDSLCDRPG